MQRAHISTADFEPFKAPVDAALHELPDYFYVIDRPCDLGTLRRRTMLGKIRDELHFWAELQVWIVG